MARRSVEAVAIGVAAVVVALLAASSARPTGGRPELVRTWPLALVGAVLLVAAAAVVVLVLTTRGPAGGDRGTARSWRGAVLLLGAALLLSLQPPPEEGVDVGPLGELALPRLPDQVATATDAVATTAAPSVLALVVGLLLAAACVVVWLRRRAHASAPTEDRGAVLAAAALRARAAPADDPRQGVIAAFAALEATFAEQGAPRPASWTQGEWVERRLLDHGARPAPARRLRAAFERARFTTAAVTPADLAAARADLAALRGDHAQHGTRP